MAFQAGAVEGKLELNTRPWTTGLTQSQSKLKSWVSKNKAQFMAMGAIAVAAFAAAGMALKKFTNLAAIQEKAVMELGAALKVTGQDAIISSADLQRAASSIQKVTTVGDEASLAIMKLGLVMGISGDNITLATKQTIGLSKAFGVDLNSAMKMVALARQGEFTMLQRYIPQIRAVTDATAKAAIVNQVLADSWKLAQAETDTFSGRLQQLSNRWGDLMENIGFKVIPFIEMFVNLVEKYVLPSLENWIGTTAKTQKAVADFLEVIKFLAQGATWIAEVFDIAGRSIANFALLITGNFAAAKIGLKEVIEQMIKYEQIRAKIGAITIEGIKKAEMPEEEIGAPPMIIPTAPTSKAQQPTDIDWMYAKGGTPQYEWKTTELPGGSTRVEQVPININVMALDPTALEDSQLDKIAAPIAERIAAMGAGR